jgi:hypothetical protein
MVRTVKSVGMVAMLSVLGVITTSAVTRSVHADDRCGPVYGYINSVFTTQNCTSPVGLCTAGTITFAGPLNAATTFLALDAAPSAGLPAVEPAANLSYSGQLTIVTAHGTLVTHDLGVIDAANLAFTELERPASGTGVFANPGSNDFFISGSIVDDGQGFQGKLSGFLCVDRP